MCGKLRYIQNMEFLTGSSTKSSKFDEYLSCWSPFSGWHCVVFVAILHGSDRLVFGWSHITGDAVPVKPFGKSSGKFLAMKSGIGLTTCTFWCFFNTWDILQFEMTRLIFRWNYLQHDIPISFCRRISGCCIVERIMGRITLGWRILTLRWSVWSHTKRIHVWVNRHGADIGFPFLFTLQW